MTGHELRGRLAGLHESMPDWVEEFLGARGLAWEQLERGELWERELPFSGLHELQQYIILSDPVRFAECVFVELQTAGQPPWRLWDYQKVSARYRANTLHQCGAEVGKTREIVLLHVWEAIASRGDSLIGAALDGHLELIWREIIGQAQVNPWLKAQIDFSRTHVKPYRDLVFTNGNTIFFRPSGVDGSAFRGVHVGGRISLDEAPKVKSSQALGNFTSRATPGAEVRLYGTPDGDRDCPFYKLCSVTPEVDPHQPPPTRDGESEEGDLVYVKFRWSKELQPAPFWSSARERQYLVDYGGRDSSEYQQNVLGHWGDPAATVFPWQRLAACLRYLSEYVVVKILHDDGDGQVYFEASRLNAAYEIRSALGDEAGSTPTEPLTRFFSDVVPKGEFAAADRDALVDRWEETLRPLVGSLSGLPVAAGVDYGSTDDPTEILIGQPVGDQRLRLVARVQLKRFDYEQQEGVIRALQRILGIQFGWGGDSTGVGSAIEHYLQRPLTTDEGWEYLDYTGIVFNATTIDRDPETGEPLTDPENPDRPRKVSWKELGTRLLETAVQRQFWEIPYDPDFMLEWSSHTARILPSGRRQFAGKNDHTIDASRCLALRLYLLRLGELSVAPMEVGVLPSGRRPSATLMEDF